MSDLLFDLRLEFVRRAPELIQHFANLSGNLRQLLGPEYDKGQNE
jgi:hypothetical protein